MQDKYLTELTEERENEAIDTLVNLRFIYNDFFRSLGLVPAFSWYLLRVDRCHLENLPQQKIQKEKPGDVDILAGPLEWKDPKEFEALLTETSKNNPGLHPICHSYLAASKLAESDGIKWPPSTDYLVGVEVKCRPKKLPQGRTDSTKKQVEGLLKMGFDRVVLLDIIPNEPEYGIDNQAWFAAADRADKSKEERYSDTIRILPENCPAGIWIFSMCAVIGGNENRRGAISKKKLREALQNPFLKDDSVVRLKRQEMESMLSKNLVKLPPPHSLDVVFINPDFSS